MTSDWTPVERELAAWAAKGMTLPVWWRDDDAVDTGPALDRLSRLAERHGFAVHLAVIPEQATQALGDYLRATAQMIGVVHGWGHHNHAPAGEKKAEFGDHRRASEMLAEAEAGLACLSDLMGPRLARMFVPPWNRVTPKVVAGLHGAGYHMVSTFTPRRAPEAVPGVAQINTHLDPIAWKAGGGLLDPDVLISRLVGQLQDRRFGRADNDEPFGLLTHHLVHDAAIWEFTDAYLGRLMDGPVRIWSAEDSDPKDTDQ